LEDYFLLYIITNEAAIDYSPIVEYSLICFTDYYCKIMLPIFILYDYTMKSPALRASKHLINALGLAKKISQVEKAIEEGARYQI